MKKLSLIVTTSIILVLGCTHDYDNSRVSSEKKAESVETIQYEVRSNEAREALGSSFIRRTPQLESFSANNLPVLNLGKGGLSPDTTVNKVLGDVEESVEIEDRGSSLVAVIGEMVFSTRKASGFYFYLNKKSLHNVPNIIEIDKEDLINIALDYIVSKEMITLASQEELTIDSVGTVKNATYDVTKQEEPVLDGEAIMGYTVIFGRMFGGVPVIGSQIRVEINTDGSVQGFYHHMRPILSVGDEVSVLNKQQVLDKITTEKGSLGISAGSSEDKIVCGYIEARMLYQQNYLQPGCYAIPQGRPSLRIPVLVSAIEQPVEPIKGERVHYPKP